MRTPTRRRRVGAVAFALAVCVAAGVSGAEAARAQRSATRQASIGQGVQLVRPFIVEAPTAATTREFDRGAAALTLVRLRAQDVFPGWTIAFRPARPGLLGMTLVKARRVEIYVRLDRPIGGIAHDIAHEFGHVADVMLNNDDQRQAYLDLRNRKNSLGVRVISDIKIKSRVRGQQHSVFAVNHVVQGDRCQRDKKGG